MHKFIFNFDNSECLSINMHEINMHKVLELPYPNSLLMLLQLFNKNVRFLHKEYITIPEQVHLENKWGSSFKMSIKSVLSISTANQAYFYTLSEICNKSQTFFIVLVYKTDFMHLVIDYFTFFSRWNLLTIVLSLSY